MKTSIERAKFTILRAVDDLAAGEKPLEITRQGPKTYLHFPNAKGGLRQVEGSNEIRQLAGETYIRLTNALTNAHTKV